MQLIQLNIIFGSDNILINNQTQYTKVSDYFSKESIDNFEKEIIKLCEKYKIQYKYLRTDYRKEDRLMGIISVISKKKQKIKYIENEKIVIQMILEYLIKPNFINNAGQFDIKQYFEIFPIIINYILNNISNTDVHLDIFYSYLLTYNLMFQVYLQNDFNDEKDEFQRYINIFDYFVSNNIWVNIFDALEKTKTLRKKDSEFSHIALSIIFSELTRYITYEDIRYYDLLKKHQDLLYDQKSEQIKPSGSLIITSIFLFKKSDTRFLFNQDRYNFFLNTMQEQMNKISIDKFKNNQLNSFDLFITRLFSMLIKD